MIPLLRSPLAALMSAVLVLSIVAVGLLASADDAEAEVGVFALSGDWNGDGRTTSGWFENGVFTLRNANSSGQADLRFRFGRAGDLPLTGDWNGDGRHTVGVIRGREWHLRDSNSGGPADHSFIYGRVGRGDYPLAGDWNRDGRYTVGVVRGNRWHLRNSNTAGPADEVFVFGRVRKGDVPVVGDWLGRGRHTPAIIRGNEWHLRYENAGGPADRVIRFGRSGDLPVVGNWNRRGGETIGMVRGDKWHLSNDLRGGKADLSFTFKKTGHSSSTSVPKSPSPDDDSPSVPKSPSPGDDSKASKSSGQMGPQGRWPTNTPPYDSPTDVIVSLTQLPNALDEASAGDVIEVRAGTYELASHLVIDRCEEGEKILVRPPLGNRGEVVITGSRRVLFDGACNVAMAGVTFAGNTSVRMERAFDIALAWIEWEDEATSVIRGSRDIDLIEHVRDEMSTSQSSALHLIRNSGSVGSERVQIVGWWHAGMWRKSGESNQAKDTIQTFHLDGGVIRDLTITDSVLFASSDKVLQNHHGESVGLSIINTWMNRPDDPFWTPPSGYTTHGSHGHVSVQEPGTDVLLYKSTILGSFSDSRARGVLRDSLVNGGSAASALDDHGGNTFDDSRSVANTPPPALRSLDDVWHP